MKKIITRWLFCGKALCSQAPSVICGLAFSPKTGTLLSLRDISPNRGITPEEAYAGHNVKNPASGRVMEKSGIVFEGVLRQHNIDKHGKFYDFAIYSILESEYIEIST